ncbi:MAG TPA: hypothetical protein VMV77_04770 [Bacteroidales bacterium]|nr:hypothetical protein [Bacteroidales bacterium]
MTKNNTMNGVNAFYYAFHCLPSNMLGAVRAEIIDQMGWAPTTFTSKINGNRNLKKPEKTILKMIFEGYGIEF